MNRKLSIKELLKIINTDIKVGKKIVSSAKNYSTVKAVEKRIQAYQKIQQFIETQPICIFSALPITEQEGACKKCANRALEDLSHQPKVGEDFIEKWAEFFKPKYMPVAALRNYKNSIKELLQKAGVKIKEEK